MKKISTTIGDQIAKSDKKIIAVADFTDLRGNITELGRFIAEEISIDLINSLRNFELIDRNHLKGILAEHELYLSDIISPEAVKRVGQIAGVDAIVTGSVTPFSDSIRVSAKIIATDRAVVIGATKESIAKTKTLDELLNKGLTRPTEIALEEEPDDALKGEKEVSLMGKLKSAFKEDKQRFTDLPQTISFIEKGQFTIENKGCKIAHDNSVNCFVKVTNNDGDRSINTKSELIIDDLGNRYHAKRKEFSNGKERIFLVHGLSSIYGISFDHAVSEAKMVSLFKFRFVIEPGDIINVEFHDIPLSQRGN